jgi:hypothetical protein
VPNGVVRLAALRVAFQFSIFLGRVAAVLVPRGFSLLQDDLQFTLPCGRLVSNQKLAYRHSPY